MLLTLCLQVCFVLVSSNPLYDLKLCPSTTFPNYGNAGQLLIHTGHNNPYLQNLLLYNQLAPNLPSNTIIPNQLANLFVPNNQFCFQNGYDTKQISEPYEHQKVINDYILVPEEYNANDGNRDRKETRNSEINIKTGNKKNRRKQRKNTSNIYQENRDENNIKINTEIKQGRVNEGVNKNSRTKRKKSKKNRHRNKTRPITTERVIDERKIENVEILEPENNEVIRLDERGLNRNIPLQKSELEASRASTSESQPKKEALGFEDVPVCFDINEDCADLDCRHTRNKDVNTRNNKPISKPQQHSPNFMNLMNTFGGNKQMSPNFFNTNMNYPFNFDYLYQTPQTTNAKTRESGTRRRNRKRKQQTNRQTNSNRKTKEFKSTTESCDKVVELIPETNEVEITTIATITTTVTEEMDSTPVVEKIENVIQETHLNNYKSDNEKPTTVDVEHVTEVTQRDENNLLFDNYNDIMDEYYPDFTSDKSYLASKEDYEITNFQDRYYYTYGDETELNRERRKYESHRDNQLHNNNIVNTNIETIVISEPSHNKNSHIAVTTESSETYIEKEQAFPSALEFPGFKTEMVNKEEYFAKKGNYESDANNFARKNIFSYSDLKENMEADEHYNNNVETVFANSKVFKYGTQVNEVTTSVPQPERKKEYRKNIPDNKPVIIIAKSIDT